MSASMMDNGSNSMKMKQDNMFGDGEIEHSLSKRKAEMRHTMGGEADSYLYNGDSAYDHK